jgi:hypothetical protein
MQYATTDFVFKCCLNYNFATATDVSKYLYAYYILICSTHHILSIFTFYMHYHTESANARTNILDGHRHCFGFAFYSIFGVET